jgi:pimeloyl-ACP methyl ester carboxylesterase
MPSLSSRTVRYARAWIAGPHDIVEEEILLDRGGVTVPATIVRPRSPTRGLPAWVVMHGITRPGRSHTQLVRFTRAVASAGIAVIVPEVPEWRALQLAPHLSTPTIAAAVRGLRNTGLVHDAPLGLVGFSFGAPHAISSAANPLLAEEIGAVCAFGGYCQPEATFRFMMSGRHEWAGQSFVLEPDAYGRWVVAANYLPSVPGYERATDVADALRMLAACAGDVGASSWDSVYDPVIERLRGGVSEEHRALFDVFARRSDAPPNVDPNLDLADGLALAARAKDPTIDATAELAAFDRPLTILHGRSDHLIAFTEAYRLREATRAAATHLTVTRLFGHSSQDPFPIRTALREVPTFAAALDRVLRSI